MICVQRGTIEHLAFVEYILIKRYTYMERENSKQKNHLQRRFVTFSRTTTGPAKSIKMQVNS